MFDLFRRDSKPSQRRNTRSDSDRDLARAALVRAVIKADHVAERRALTELLELEPREPRWAHKLGDALRKAGMRPQAAQAYRRAAELYAEVGFAQRSHAMTRLARSLSDRSGPLNSLHPSLAPDAGTQAAVSPTFQLAFEGRRVP